MPIITAIAANRLDDVGDLRQDQTCTASCTGCDDNICHDPDSMSEGPRCDLKQGVVISKQGVNRNGEMGTNKVSSRDNTAPPAASFPFRRADRNQAGKLIICKGTCLTSPACSCRAQPFSTWYLGLHFTNL